VRWLLVAGLAAVAACGFSSPSRSRPDGHPELPEVVPEVRFVSVTASEAALRPGRYGIEVAAVLRNGLPVEITAIRASLALREGGASRAGVFRWRDADARDGVQDPQPASIPPGEEAAFRFRVDALASAALAGPISLEAEAAFQIDGRSHSATPLDPPTSLPFEILPAPIVVTTAADEDNGGAAVSFREAVQRANQNPGFDRIVFDPAAFPPSNPVVAVLDESLGELEPVTGDLVIDGSSAGFTLAVDAGWENPGRRYGLRLASGTLVVHGVGFQDLGHNYPLENLNSDNCGSGTMHDGGAIRVDGGTLILDSNRFADPGVGERNCFAASVRLLGGSGHRVLNNQWTDPAMDALYVQAATREVSGNVMDGGRQPARSDDCIVVESLAGADLWIVGNLCVDPEQSAVAAGGANNGKLYVVNNTFARSGAAAVRRLGNNRRVELHNNAYVSNLQAAILATNNGVDFTISHEAESGDSPFCGSCTSALIQQPTIVTDVDLQLAAPAGTSAADFTPRSGSPLVDSGLDLVDRNGPVPGRFNGAGPERGAVELP